jgi:hypothetical protein
MMLYGSYAFLAQHWAPWAVLAFVWGVIFASNMARKEVSLRQKPGWAEYAARSGVLLPALFARPVKSQ